ncbi:hypothetical protein AVEN_187669-1 [Araneus ventricosus]|uniref:Uncharacterized protein n=1 Tax=Araneus ventricosus TaxID=182803 RepID=A0A4Y2M6Q2_ARAVE|nr:hypothetical protein AVEN_187669-1 [Araneus ventricosus]
MGRIDVARGPVSAFVVSSVMAVKGTRRRHCICSLEHYRDICKFKLRMNGATVQIPPTTVHKYEPRATRGLSKPHAVGTRLKEDQSHHQ